MFRRSHLFIIILVLCVILPTSHHAFAKSRLGSFGLELSIGGNYDLLVNDTQKSERLGLNTELLLSYKFLILSGDLGVLYDFRKAQAMLRPGMRLFLGWLYFRLAIPIALPLTSAKDDMFNLGILVGAGVQIKIKKFIIVFEGNVSPFFININDRGLLMPAEARFGIGYYF